LDKGREVLSVSLLDALIDDVRGAFLHAELVDLAKELVYEALALLWVPVFENVLQSVIPIWVLC